MIKIIKKAMMLTVIAVFGFSFVIPQLVQAHCQIPCGIYDDHARVQSMLEDAATVEKSIKLIEKLIWQIRCPVAKSINTLGNE